VNHSGFPGWGQYSRHVEVGTDANPGRRVFLTYIREQEQHQERAAARCDIDTPRRVVAALGIAGLAREAEIDMPSEVARISRRGKSHDEIADVRPRSPPFRPVELVKGVIEDVGAGGLAE
jgi:hypothetical protein